MKKFTLLFIFISTSITFSQGNYTLEWESSFTDRYFFGIANFEKNNSIQELIFRKTQNQILTYYVYDGATKSLKYTYVLDNLDLQYFGDKAHYIFYPDLQPIDVNNDGVYELIGAKLSTIKILNGINGNILHTFTFTEQAVGIVGVCDIDGDGYIELIISRGQTSAESKIYIYSTPAQTIGLPNNQNTATDFNLGQNYPNPFNPSTTIEYSLSQQSNVLIKLYDVLGQDVKTLVDDKKGIGTYKIEFDGSGLSSGTYFYQIILDGLADTKKMVLIK